MVRGAHPALLLMLPVAQPFQAVHNQPFLGTGWKACATKLTLRRSNLGTSPKELCLQAAWLKADHYFIN
jgi:hypothetical protein